MREVQGRGIHRWSLAAVSTNLSNLQTETPYSNLFVAIGDCASANVNVEGWLTHGYGSTGVVN